MNRARISVSRCTAVCVLAISICSLLAAGPAIEPAADISAEPDDIQVKDPFLQSPTPHPATTRSALDIRVDGQTELTAAIRVLTKEYNQHLRDPKSAIRSASSYFQDQPSPDVSAEAIAEALARHYSGDPRMDAYVKWQLLSGIDSPTQGIVVNRLLLAYRSAVAPAPLPGLDQNSRLVFERQRTLIIREGEVDSLDRELHERQDAVNRANEPILAYRNALFAKLPLTYDALAAGLQDCYVRLDAGADVDSIETPLAEAISKWMDDPKATASQMASLASAMTKLGEQKVSYIDAVKWDQKKRQAKFEEKNLSINSRSKLMDLVNDLKSAEEHPAPKTN